MTAQATVTVTISGTEVSVSGDIQADRSQFSVSGGGFLELNGKSDIDGSGSSNDILVSAITRFEYGDTNDEIVFTGSNVFTFHALTQLWIPEANSLEIYADLDLRATGSGTPSSAAIFANLYRMAVISGASIKMAQGDLEVTANGQGSGNQPGIAVLNSTIESVGTGSVMLSGIGNEADGSIGVVVDQSSTISTTSGQLTFTGTGGGEHDGNIGVQITSSCSVFSIAGDLWITGNGGGESGGTGNHGVLVEGDLLGDGNQVEITGMTTSDGPTNRGVAISGGSIEGTANISINGIGQNGDGVRIDDSATIFTPAGMVHLSGSATSNGSNQGHGVVIEGANSLVESETGSIQISGNSGDGDQSVGVLISGSSIVRSITATIMIDGSANGMILSDGVRLEGAAQIASLTGNIEFFAESEFGRGIYADGLGIDIGGHTSGSVTFFTDDYEIRSPVSSQGYVQIQPKTDGVGIEVGSATGAVNLEQDEIDLLLTPELVIGDINNTTGDVSIDGVDFAQELTVEADASIIVNDVNSGSLWIHDVNLVATGSVEGGGSSTSHLEAANLEIEVDGDVGSANPLLIDVDGLKVVANSADFGGSGTFDQAHIDVEQTTTFRNGFVFSVNRGLFVGVNQDSGSIISVIGQVNLNGANLTYGLSPLTTFAFGDSINLINNDGADVVRGRFNGVFEGDVIGSGPSFQVSYVGGTGNDVSFTVVP